MNGVLLCNLVVNGVFIFLLWKVKKKGIFKGLFLSLLGSCFLMVCVGNMLFMFNLLWVDFVYGGSVRLRLVYCVFFISDSGYLIFDILCNVIYYVLILIFIFFGFF